MDGLDRQHRHNIGCAGDGCADNSPAGNKVVINQVQINPDPKSGKDVYAEKNGELALTKKGLAKLMAAANIQAVDSLVEKEKNRPKAAR